MKFLLFVLALGLASSSDLSSAGHENGNSGGTLARLLSYAHREVLVTLPMLPPRMLDFGSPKMTNWYASHYTKMTKDIKNIRFAPVSERIFDSYYGYESWIRINTSSGLVVEYSPDVSAYQRLVGVINLHNRGIGTSQDISPSILDVTEYLLHEIGHIYGLNEHDAWEFAQTLLKHFNFTKEILPLTCHAHIDASGVSPSNFINEDVTLDSAHPIHVFKLGRFGYRLELSERRYEAAWSVTEETARGVIETHQMVSYPGVPFSGSAMTDPDYYASVYCTYPIR